MSAKQIVEPGDIVVLTAGIPARSEGVAKEGISNMMRIAVVEIGTHITGTGVFKNACP